MKCSKCGKEWTPDKHSIRTATCPFCNAALPVDLGKSDELTMQDVSVMIVDCFGADILGQKERFLAVFRDFAPKLDHEHKLLKIALEEDIAKGFLTCTEEYRASYLEKVKKKLVTTLSKEATEQIVTSFSVALGWNKEPKDNTEQQPQMAKTDEGRPRKTLTTILEAEIDTEQDETSAMDGLTNNLPHDTSQKLVSNTSETISDGIYAEQRTATSVQMSIRPDGEFLKKGNSCRKDGKYKEAIQWFRQAADLGNVYAKRALHQIEEEQNALMTQGDTLLKRGEIDAAIDFYRKALDKADGRAEKAMGGALLEKGNKCRDDDIHEAMKWYQLAEEKGHPDAKRTMGEALLKMGNECRASDDIELAMKWYQLAEEKGHPDAKKAMCKALLGKGYECRNRGDINEAMNWYQLAEEKGHPDAIKAMGEMLLEKGDECRKNGDINEAMKWYQLAMEKGHPDAKRTIGETLLDKGKECQAREDIQQAMKWYQLADNLGVPDARNAMRSALLETGRRCTSRGKIQEAEKYYQMAIDMGDRVAGVEVDKVKQIAGILSGGADLRRRGELSEAAKRYQKAVDLGVQKASEIISSIMLEQKGNAAYNNGDIDGAMKYYQMAIDQGDDTAREIISNFMYEEAKGCYDCGSEEEAAKWCGLAAKYGHELAIKYLVDKNWLENDVIMENLPSIPLAKILQKAANVGDATAMKRLGDLYYNGEGVAQDTGTAMEWYRKAADAGNAEAKKKIGWLQYSGYREF